MRTMFGPRPGVAWPAPTRGGQTSDQESQGREGQAEGVAHWSILSTEPGRRQSSLAVARRPG